MGFFDDIIGGAGSLIGGIFGGSSSSRGGNKSGGGGFNWGGLATGLISTALTGYALHKMSKSVAPTNNTPAVQAATPDYGVRLQFNPDTNQKIPVLYGTSVFGGIITDAQISNDNKTMHYVITLSERTGTKISDDQASTYKFKNIYWNDNRIIFDADGITALYSIDRDGNIDKNIAGLVQVYCYAGSSTTPVVPVGYANSNLSPAYSIVPNWTSSHAMENLVFAVVRVDYNKDHGTVSIPTVNFNVENSMAMPGDCLYDYMTNTRYGAGVAPEEIYIE